MGKRTSCRVVPPRALRDATLVPVQRFAAGTSLKNRLQ
jgi:hypothetical protein